IDQHIVCLQVAMDSSLPVNEGKALADFFHQAKASGYAETAGSPQMVQQRLPVHVFHGEVGTVIVLGQQPQVVDLDEMTPAGMVAAGDNPCQHEHVSKEC